MFGSWFGVTDKGTGELSMGGGRRACLPQGRNFDGPDTKFHNWLKHFTLHAKHCDLLDTCISPFDTQIDQIGIDLSPKEVYAVSQLKKTQVVWSYLFNVAAGKSVHAMIHGAGSPVRGMALSHREFTPFQRQSDQCSGEQTLSFEDETG